MRSRDAVTLLAVGGSVAGALLLPGVQASRVPPEVEVVRIRDAPGCPGSGELPTPGNISSTRTAILCLLNRARAEHGLAPLTRNSSLELASQRHSEDMARRDFYEHDTPEGLAPISRMAIAGYPTGTASVGENIHWGRDVNATPVRIFQDWMESAGHRANILLPHFTEVGVGVAHEAPHPAVQGPVGVYTTDFGGR